MDQTPDASIGNANDCPSAGVTVIGEPDRSGIAESLEYGIAVLGNGAWGRVVGSVEAATFPTTTAILGDGLRFPQQQRPPRRLSSPNH